MAIHVSHRLDIVRAARDNTAFRRVVKTGNHQQIVVMTIPPDGEIGAEVHPGTDQILIVLNGLGEAHVDAEAWTIPPGEIVFVPAGRRHNILNRGAGPMRLVSIYAPPAHPPGTVHLTKEEADAAEG